MKKVLIIGGLRRPDRTSTWVCRDVFGPDAKIQYTLVGFQARDGLVVDVRSAGWDRTLGPPESYDMVIHEHAIGMGRDSTLHANLLRGAHRLLKSDGRGVFVVLGWGMFKYGTLIDSNREHTVFYTKPSYEAEEFTSGDDADWVRKRLRLVSRERGVSLVKEFMGRYGFAFSRTRTTTTTFPRYGVGEKYSVWKKTMMM